MFDFLTEGSNTPDTPLKNASPAEARLWWLSCSLLPIILSIARAVAEIRTSSGGWKPGSGAIPAVAGGRECFNPTQRLAFY
ncbi:hypothetical protein EYF80_009783 [Liparis tanakae]|uniref:Uncharacterized protein n=1 Tax=Liparis tanakae TaxID=230148 RepID=A0A4Z2IQ22_9TELE|nr:hypothetical protein EYF80_009783 [Liparis tanakae]